MPELPEVETVVRDLRPLLEGRRLTGVWASRRRLRWPWSPAWGKRLPGRRIEQVGRRGKWILLRLDDGTYLVLHLGMTGQLTVTKSGEPRAAHTHLIFTLDDGREQLRFRDIRRFGSAALCTAAELHERLLGEQGRLGPEPFDLQADYWQRCLAQTRRCLKAVLLDQRVVAGVGNIYADEALHEARLHPARLACALEAGEAERLRAAIQTVLRRAIDRRGSSIRDYVGGSGLRGEYQNEFRVYGRTGTPCPRCRTAIACIRLAGRSTHFCPQCQKEGCRSSAAGLGR